MCVSRERVILTCVYLLRVTDLAGSMFDLISQVLNILLFNIISKYIQLLCKILVAKKRDSGRKFQGEYF